MGDVDLRASLARVEGDAPTDEFLASLLAEVEVVKAVPAYALEPAAAPVTLLRRPRRPAPRWWLRTGVAVAAVVLLVVLAVVRSSGDGSQVATTRLPHGYSPSDLPTSVVQPRDGAVVLTGGATWGLDAVVPPWYRETRAAIEDGFVAGLSIPFDVEVPSATLDCTGAYGAIPTWYGSRIVRCGGSSGALVFADDAAAARALDALADHLETHTAGVYGVGVPLEPTGTFEPGIGEEADGFVLEEFVDARYAAQVPVIVWRTDNLVQYVWDIQERGAPGGVQALNDVARRIEERVTN